MNRRKNLSWLAGVVILTLLALGYYKRQFQGKPAAAVNPREFEPESKSALPEAAVATLTDTSITVTPEPEIPEPEPEKPFRKPAPTVAELQTVAPELEARRALSNDAMKAATMSFPEFSKYMQSRIPYYKGKGNLKAKNDFVFIQISATEMQLETAKGRVVYPMK